MNCKFIFVVGGVVSSLGKGLSAASIAACLIEQGYRVRVKKLDPYLNIDCGTMNPDQHGEVYVTDDGVEADMDLGHYERFTGIATNCYDIITAGKVFKNVLEKERRGEYLGDTVQVVPHVINQIKDLIFADLSNEDFLICEIGGTVGDIEILPFIETLRQIINDLGKEQVMCIQLTLVPYIESAQELKTKPTQHSVKTLLSYGVQPDLLICRSKNTLSVELKNKIALFCNVPTQRVFCAPDVDCIYYLPLFYHNQSLDSKICEYFSMSSRNNCLDKWQGLNEQVCQYKSELNIAIIIKYTKSNDSYISVAESLHHAGISNKVKINVQWISAEDIEDHSNIDELFSNIKALIVPGGFGVRGVNGKLKAIQWARNNNLPYLGICLGMQLAIVEFAKNVLNMNPDLLSKELEGLSNNAVNDNDYLINLLNVQGQDIGGTMRLGGYNCKLTPNSLINKLYNQDVINERHRHRYGLNVKYKKELHNNGMIISGVSTQDENVEAIEYKNHPWFIGVQFHPEFKSNPFNPHPLFVSFVEAAKNNNNGKKNETY